MKPKLCLCSKVLSDLSLEECARTAAGIGYAGLEIFGIPGHLPPGIKMQRVRDYRALADDLGLETVVLDTYVGDFDTIGDSQCEEQLEIFKRYLYMAELLACPYVRVSPTYLGMHRRATDEECSRFADWTRRCADLASLVGRSVVLENNLSMIGTVSGTLKVLELIGRDSVGLNYDPGNIYRLDDAYGGEAVRKFGGRILNVQVKQCDRDGDRFKLLFDEGKVEYGAVFRALKESGYRGFLSAECHREPDAGMTSEAIARHEFEKIGAAAADVWREE